jgi:hypothetical protein
MSELSFWLLVGTFLGGAAGFASRNTALHKRVKAAQYPSEVTIEAYERALRQVTSIGTPVAPAYSLIHFLSQDQTPVTNLPHLFTIAAVILYVFLWLSLQRVAVADVDVGLDCWGL